MKQNKQITTLLILIQIRNKFLLIAIQQILKIIITMKVMITHKKTIRIIVVMRLIMMIAPHKMRMKQL
jgi:hypothetical protein